MTNTDQIKTISFDKALDLLIKGKKIARVDYKDYHLVAEVPYGGTKPQIFMVKTIFNGGITTTQHKFPFELNCSELLSSNDWYEVK